MLAIAVCAVYWRALDAPFIFDDIPGIVENPSIARLWPPVGDDAHRGPLNPPGLAPTARRPLVNLSFALNHSFGGLDPRGYRVVNLVLHILNAALLAALVRRTLLLPYFGGTYDGVAEPLSLVVALLWAVHPLVTEAVAYVMQRTELMGALCYLTTLWAALQYWDARSAAGRARWLAVAVAASLGGAASKEIIVSAPLVVFLYERTFLAGSRRERGRSWPLYTALCSGCVLLLILSASGIGGLSDARHRIPLHVWWMTQAKVLFLYAKLIVWPWPLSIHYAPTFLRTVAAAWPWLAAAMLAVIATAVLVWRRPAVRFVAIAMALVLAPTAVVPLPKMVAAERRLYLPLAGVIVLAVVGAYRLIAARWPRVGRRIAVATAAALIVVAGGASATRLRAYESAVSIWQDAVRHQPADPMAHYNLGVALVESGAPAEDAMRSLERALALDPEHTGALDNIGMLLHRSGRTADAMVRFEQALRIDPGDAVAHNNLGGILTGTGRTEDAIPHLRLALALQPDAPKAKIHLNLGQALLAAGEHVDEGIAHLEEAVRAAPDDADAHYALGASLSKLGRPQAALPHLERAHQLAPEDADALVSLATALLQVGDKARAIETYRRALALAPDSFEARNNLGAALSAVGRTSEAITELERALRAEPDHANAHYNLARALLDSGRPRDAIAHCEAAVRLDPTDAQARFQCATAYARADDTDKAAELADDALARARARGETALVDEIEAWLAARPRR